MKPIPRARRTSTAVLTVVALAFPAGCAAVGGSEEEGSASGDSVTVTDSAGRIVTIDQPVKRVAIVNKGAATVMSGLGVAAGDLVIEPSTLRWSSSSPIIRS